ncbi:uncharacterized protein LOC128491476 [Spea bombifrons]|uniref:uncharacterized protein LOC128491476 n=1 Tax=Spea bombifrons TaxID=233779 RepID=UPI00234B23FE|nr:uncharacterized protein LOC128491476 [Spea bombifrons]
MEKLQLCLDDEDDLPMRNETRSTDRHEDSAPQPDIIFEFAASARSDLNREKWDDHGCNEKAATCDGFVSLSNTELPCRGKDNVSVDNLGRRVESSFQKPTKLNTQDAAKAKSSSAQDLFWESMLRAQLCVLDLQDELEKKEKHINFPGISPSEIRSPLPCLDSPSTGLQDDGAEEEPFENYETFCCEEEVEDESLFCDNPIFSHAPSPSTQPCYRHFG